MTHKLAGLLLAAVILSGTGCADKPLGPSTDFPAVAGTYSGPLLLTVGNTTATCTVTTTVTQADSVVTFSPLVMTGDCAKYFSSLTLGGRAITVAGVFAENSARNLPFPSCNGTYDEVADGGFTDQTLHFTLAYTATSGGCVSNPGNFSFSATLSR